MVFALILILLLAAAALVMILRPVMTVSTGAPIPKGRKRSALLLIDLQRDFLEPGPYPAAERAAVMRRISTLIDAARVTGRPVVALRHGWRDPGMRLLSKLAMHGTALAGSPGAQLVEPIRDVDHVIDKSVQDGFADGTLDALLDYLGVGSLEIAGLDASACVATTAEAALNRGYHVTIREDAILGRSGRRWPKRRARLVKRGALLASAS